MRIETTLCKDDLVSITRQLGMTPVDFYEHPNKTRHTFTMKLRVDRDNTSYRSENPITGRKVGFHIPCWHGYRDFYRELFSYDPDAKIVTGGFSTPEITYNGSDDFESNHKDTAYWELGSQIYPYAYIDKCAH